MPPFPLVVAFAVAGAVAALILLDRMIRNVTVTATVVLVVSAVVVIFGTAPAATVGGFQVTLTDLLTAFVGAAFAARLLRRAQVPRPAWGLVVILLLVLWSLFRGIGDHGVATAANEARGTLNVYFVALYFATMKPSEQLRERIGRAWLLYAVFLVVLAVERWLAVFGPLPTSDAWYIPGEYGGLRVLWSDEAFALGQALVILLPGLMRGGLTRVQRVMAMVVLATVLLTQHRSVWAATLVGIALVLLLEGNIGRRWARRLILATGIVAVALMTFFSGPLLEQTVSSSDAARSETFEWRMEGWTALYRDSGPESLAEVAVGRPYGAGWLRRLTSLGYSTDVVPHNYYVEQSLRVGVIGVIALLVVYGGVMRRLSWLSQQRPQDGLLSDRMLLILLAMQLLYYIPYWPSSEQALLLGIAVAATRASGRPPDDGAAATATGGAAGSGGTLAPVQR